MMNSSGWIRGMMSKRMSHEEYIGYVTQCIANQLHSWDESYVVQLWEEKINDGSYQIIIRNNENIFTIFLSKEESVQLQQTSPYSLDKKILGSLMEQGFILQKSNGNYLMNCFI